MVKKVNENRRLGTIPHFPCERGAVMLRMSSLKPSSTGVPAPKHKRGRPRKSVAPEALLPFETSKVKKNKKYSKYAEEESKNKQTNPATSERNYSSDEVEFMNALSEFKRTSGRLFPTCSEILGVLRTLGYEKVQEQQKNL